MTKTKWKLRLRCTSIRSKPLFFLGLVSMLPMLLSSQNFGGMPPGDQWMIKKGKHIDVIYSNEATDIADSVASTVGQINNLDPYSLGPARRSIPIILRNKNLTTNGFVAYVPYRSELFLYGAQNPNVLGFHNWMELLTLHEYRHVLQYSNLDRGITRLTGRLLGHAAQAGIYNILIPNWFSEGDAVFYESRLTGNGRGQLPAFMAQFRALMLEDTKYNYHKYRNGSFKNFVPNHYVHGYLLTASGYERYGESFWPDIMAQTSRIKGLLWPFRQAIRRKTNLSLPEFHRDVIDRYQTNLLQQLDTTLQLSAQYFEKDDIIKDELQVLVDEENQTYLLESSYDEISTVYQMEGDKKKKLFALGRTFDPYLILRKNRIIFTNSGYDNRWTNREYSDVYFYDLDKHTINRVTKNKKYLSVDYQPTTDQYLAVQAGENGRTSIVVFTPSHDTVDTLLLEAGAYFSYPRWIKNDPDQFIFTRRKHGKMTLARHRISTNSTVDLLGPWQETIARPVLTETGVYFSSSRSGIDNIYYYNFQSNDLIPVSRDLIGAYNPTVVPSQYQQGEAQLFYSAMTAKGHRIRMQKVQAGQLRNSSGPPPPQLQPILSKPTTSEQIFSSQDYDGTQLTAERYKPGHHLFHFHSLLLEPSLTTPQLSYLSNDYLNTTRANLYIKYRNGDKSWETGGEMTYAGWFPEITLGANYRFNRHLNLRVNEETIQLPKTETSANIAMALPFNFSRRQVGHFLRINGQYGWTKEHFDRNDPVLPGSVDLSPRTFQTVLFSTNWSLTRLRAYRDMIPKWGITTAFLAKRSFTPGKSWMLYGNQNFYLPGFFRNDGFKFRWQAQLNNVAARDFLPFELNSLQDLPFDFSTFQSGALLTANYLFPLAYPEISIPHVLYTKRLGVNLFTEHYLSRENTRTWSGIDVFLTAKYFNLIELTGGLRVSRQWHTEHSPYAWSLVLIEDL